MHRDLFYLMALMKMTSISTINENVKTSIESRLLLIEVASGAALGTEPRSYHFSISKT